MSGKLLILKPNGQRKEIDHAGPGMLPLHTIQEAVGGYIERVRVHFNDREYSAYIDEDGRRKKLTPNLFGTLRLAPPFDPSSSRHQLVGNVAVWMPDTRNIDRVAQGVVTLLLTGLETARFQPITIAASLHEPVADWQTCPVIAQADSIQQVFSHDQCVIYFRHPGMATGPSMVLLMLDNGPEMVIDSASPDEEFFQAMEQIRKAIFDEFED